MEEKRPNQCVVDGCELDRYDEHGKCILHCEKDNFTKEDCDFFAHALQELYFIKSSGPPNFLVLSDVIFPKLFTPGSYRSQFDIHALDDSFELQIHDCIFLGDTVFKHPKMVVTNSTFNGKVTFRALEFEYCSFTKCTFNSALVADNIESHTDFSILSCNLNDRFSSRESIFYNFKISDSTFNSAVSIHYNTFKINGKVSLSTNTFKSYVNFEDNKFYTALSIRTCGFLSGVSFLGIESLHPNFYDKTTRETYRIIKHSFDSIGNTIEANNYFALEMDKLYSELNWKNNFSEKLLLAINKCTSNFGQNWWLPILWIFGFASIFYFLRKYDPFDYPFLNGIASFIIPYQGIIGTTHQMSKLLTSILFGVLIYQTTVALKRKTRR